MGRLKWTRGAVALTPFSAWWVIYWMLIILGFVSWSKHTKGFCGCGSTLFYLFIHPSPQILESRERSDPASGENRDSAIIVSHLVRWLQSFFLSNFIWSWLIKGHLFHFMPFLSFSHRTWWILLGPNVRVRLELRVSGGLVRVNNYSCIQYTIT